MPVIAVDFPGTNGILCAGIAAGHDRSLAEAEKLQIGAPKTKTDGARERHAASSALAITNNINGLSPKLRSAMVSSSIALIRGNFLAREQGSNDPLADVRLEDFDSAAYAGFDPCAKAQQDIAIEAASDEGLSKGMTLAIGAVVTFFGTNHHSAMFGNPIPQYLKKICMTTLGMNDREVRHDSTLTGVRMVGHWFNNHRVCTLLDIDHCATRGELDLITVTDRVEFELADDVKLRMSVMPAGIGEHAVVAAAFKRFKDHRIMALYPDKTGLKAILKAVAEVYTPPRTSTSTRQVVPKIDNRARYHMGALHLTGEMRRHITLPEHVGLMGSIVVNLAPNSSLARSPQFTTGSGANIVYKYRDRESFSPEWEAVCESFKMAKVVVTGALVKAAAAGTATGFGSLQDMIELHSAAGHFSTSAADALTLRHKAMVEDAIQAAEEDGETLPDATVEAAIAMEVHVPATVATQAMIDAHNLE